MATAGVTLAFLAASALGPAAPYMRSRGIPVPRILPQSLREMIFIIVTFYLVGQVVLLILAIATVGNRDIHDRFLDLMLRWPYALIAPYTIITTRVLPKRYFGRARPTIAPSPNATSGHRRIQNSSLSAASVGGDDPSAVTPEQYRSALRLAMEQLSSIKMDRDLQDLVLKQPESLEQQGRPDQPRGGPTGL